MPRQPKLDSARTKHTVSFDFGKGMAYEDRGEIAIPILEALSETRSSRLRERNSGVNLGRLVCLH